MMETLGFDTEHLLWIAKQNKEAFSTLVNHNQMIANSSAENLEQAAFVEEKSAINKKNRLKTGPIYNIIAVLTPCKQEQPTR